MSVVALAVTLFNAQLGTAAAGMLGGTWVAFSRWWSLVPLGLLFLLFVYGLMKANHEAFEKIELEHKQERKRLQKVNTELRTQVTALESRPRTEAEDLKHECLQLGMQLDDITEQWVAMYHEERQRESSPLQINAQIEEQLQSAQTEAERRRIIEKLEHQNSKILKQARREYDRDFRQEAAQLLERAQERYGINPGYKEMAKDAGVDLGQMREVAKILCKVGRRS